MEPYKYQPIGAGTPTAICSMSRDEIDRRYRILFESRLEEFHRLYTEMNEFGRLHRLHAEVMNHLIGRELFKTPVPRCTTPYVPPQLTAAEERAMEEVMNLFRNSDF